MPSGEYLRALVALFVVVNPLGALPAFLALTLGDSEAQRRRTARIAALSVATLLVVSIFAGRTVLAFMGIEVQHFKVGGGIMLLLIATTMLNAQPSRARETPEELGEAEERDEVGAVPLGTPLLVGPGSISTAIIQADTLNSPQGRLWLVFVALLVALTTLLVLRAADRIRRVLGHTGINIATRLEGLLLAALAVRFIIEGLVVLMPGLAH
ncbi:MAG: NAAT family transporter [Fimbriimonadaceae bacterium]|nr:NAAT family transporter [Fimbriimonadaceae bacterium]